MLLSASHFTSGAICQTFLVRYVKAVVVQTCLRRVHLNITVCRSSGTTTAMQYFMSVLSL